MNRKTNALLRLILASSLSDRDRFVEKTSSVIERAVGGDEAMREQMGERLYQTLDALNEEMLLSELLGDQPVQQPIPDQALGEKIDRLTEAINHLSEVLEKQKGEKQ